VQVTVVTVKQVPVDTIENRVVLSLHVADIESLSTIATARATKTVFFATLEDFVGTVRQTLNDAFLARIDDLNDTKVASQHGE